MYRVNRYCHGKRWFWRVWRGSVLLAKSARSYANTQRGSQQMERDLRSLFPHLVK